jgi:hypothetical protein
MSLIELAGLVVLSRRQIERRVKGSGSRVALEVVEILPHQELGPEARNVGRSHLR